MKSIALSWLAALAAFSLPALAQEPCQACKHLDCLKDSLRYTNEWADEYEKLRQALATKMRIQSYDFSVLDEATKSRLAREINAHATAYNEGVAAIQAKVKPLMGGCGAAGVSVATTHSQNCEIDPARLAAARAGSACRELGDAVQVHENFHRARCLERRTRTYMDPGNPTPQPAIFQTWTGRASEEAAAHRAGAVKIREIIDRLEGKCKLSFKDVSLRCEIEVPGPGGSVITERILTGHTCGDPGKNVWTFKPRDVMTTRIRGVRPSVIRTVDKPFQSDCVEAESGTARQYAEVSRKAMASGHAGGFNCIYKYYPGETAPRMWLRHYPLQMCKGAREESIPLRVEATEGCND